MYLGRDLLVNLTGAISGKKGSAVKDDLESDDDVTGDLSKLA